MSEKAQLYRAVQELQGFNQALALFFGPERRLNNISLNGLSCG